MGELSWVFPEGMPGALHGKEGFFMWKLSAASFLTEFSVGNIRGGCPDFHAGLQVLHVAVVIWATLVNTQTYTALDCLYYELSHLS